MANKLITRCPITNEPLIVKKLYSPKSQITIEGEFNLSKFNLLKDEHLYFIEVFVKNRGNIKLVEKELNISYPSVKKLLDETIMGLGYNILDNKNDDNEEEESTDSINSILKLVEDKQITTEEAYNLMFKKRWFHERWT